MNLVDTKKRSFIITTPIYYVNDLPHIGSAYTTMAADVAARFHRLRGETVLSVTGTDEHGQKIQRTAAELGRSPQEHCDQIVAGFQALWKKLNIQYDRFIRTTDPRHEAIVREFYQRVWDNGDIYLGQQQGWYCVACEEYKEERELLPDHHCPIHTNRACEWRDEENYFFRLSKYQHKLETLYAERPNFIQPEIRRNEVLSFVNQGLQDFSISRVNLDWGIRLPNNPHHTIYVWFDALLNYVTAVVPPEQEPTLANAIPYWPATVHLIGKDILRFHAVYWPAMLMSAGMEIPDCVFGHGFLTKDGQKMGKSLGNVIDPFDLVDRFGSDAVRYYFLKEIEFGRDGDFAETRFINIVNADLANDLGNLLNRTLKMVHKYCDRTIPAVSADTLPDDDLLKSKGVLLEQQVAAAYEALAFSQACEAILTLVRAGNKYLDEQAPWKVFKAGDQATVNQILYAVLETVRLAAFLLSPVIPTVSNRVYQQLGYSIDFNHPQAIKLAPYEQHARWGALPAGQVVGDPEPVFPRLEVVDSSSTP
ncbi:MAG TPA: methionine--tRNA ligase [Synechococcales cyanobacterium M55_K2018_004]|nr:methionine--tRNA ligase [Synechococcales cyanobacterium M55_K2018_004]